MVSESEKSSGVVLPWEQSAIRGDEMPDGLDYPDQILYLSLRMLYHQARHKVINRETAVKEKKKLLDEYRQNKFREDLGDEWVKVIRQTEVARSEFCKNPTVENGYRLIDAIEGRV